MFKDLFKSRNAKKIEKLEAELKDLREDVDKLLVHTKQLYDTISVVSIAQYQIGNDVGMIYNTLKTITASASSIEDDLFSFVKDDDDKGYLN